MRLLYITNARMPTEKAHGWQIVKMCQAFANTGANIELFVPRRRNIIKQDAFNYYGINKNFKIRYLPCLDLVTYGRLGFYIQVATFTLSGLFIGPFKKSDVIYSRDEVLSFVMSIFRKNVYYEMHDYPRSHRWLYRGLFRRVEKIVSTNQIKKDRLIKEFGVPEEKVAVQPNGIDLSAFENDQTSEVRESLQLPADRKIISYVGKYKTFGQGKGVQEMIGAFSKLQNSAFLLLVGINQDEEAEVESLLQESSVSRGTYRIVPHVSHAEIPAYLQASDALIMNYPNTEHYSQFMSPIKMFEYMASGTPIVATDLPSVREILNENNAVLVEPDNSQALAEGISRALNDEAFAQKIAAQAREDVKKYDWNKRAQALLGIMRTV